MTKNLVTAKSKVNNLSPYHTSQDNATNRWQEVRAHSVKARKAGKTQLQTKIFWKRCETNTNNRRNLFLYVLNFTKMK